MKFFSVVCILWAFAGSCLALNREAFTFTKYDLNLHIEPEQQRLAARGNISLRNDSGVPQKNLSLQISSSLGWRSIQVSGHPVQFLSQTYTSDIDHTGALSEAIVTLPQEVPPKGTVEIEIGYEGVIPLDTTRLTRIGVPDDQAKHTDWDQIGARFTAVRGVGYVTWYPVAIEAASLSDANSVFEAVGRWKARETQASMTINLTNSDEGSGARPTLLCNGKVAQQFYEQTGRARSATTECSYDPIGMNAPFFGLGNYDTVDQPQLKIYYFAEHKSAAENYALAAQKVTTFITDWFGAPHHQAEVVELSDPEAAPYESGSMLLTTLNDVGTKPAEIAAVHQLTHASFSSPRPWIYEGLAHFAQALCAERQSGRQAALDFMESHRAAIADTEKTLASERAGKTSAEQSLIDTNIEELYRSKAMYVWWMLRDMVGEQALKRALAAYHPDEDKNPAYLQRLIEAQTKSDLTWFFDDWVYHDRGLPDFRVASVYPSKTAQGSYMVTVTVENLGSAGAEVPVTIRTPETEVTKRLEVRGKSRNSVRVVVTSPPQEIVVNDGSVPESDLSNNLFKVPPVAETH